MNDYFTKAIQLLGDDRKHLPRIVLVFLLISMLDLVSIGLVGPFLGLVFDGGNSLPLPFKETLFPADYSHHNLVIIIGISMLVIYAIKSVASALIMRVVINFSQQQQVNIRSQLITSYQRMPYSKLIQHNSSEYINKMQQMVPNYASLVLSCLQALADSIVVMVIISFLAWTNPYAFLLLAGIVVSSLVLFDSVVRRRITNWQGLCRTSLRPEWCATSTKPCAGLRKFAFTNRNTISRIICWKMPRVLRKTKAKSSFSRYCRNIFSR
ncbi:MAG: hypothetical protein ACNYPI_11980 [Arenicellales bacterium WSBS_2016_MAG_OTU3]